MATVFPTNIMSGFLGCHVDKILNSKSTKNAYLFVCVFVFGQNFLSGFSFGIRQVASLVVLYDYVLNVSSCKRPLIGVPKLEILFASFL